MKNMMFSANENIDYSQSTKKTFGSRNLFVLIMAILAAVSDLALLVVFAVAGHGGLAIPIILLIIDGLFITGICLSNFRFKYSIGIWVAYIVISVIVTAILASLNSGETYMTDTAKSLNVFAHIALYLVTIFASVYPLFKNSVKLKAVMITATAVAVVLVGAFSIFFSVSGYFGQGFVGSSRVVGYTLDEESDTYIATSIKNGRSDKVIIPEEFNGKKVSGVNCSIFTYTSIKTVEIESLEKVDLVDTQLLEYINKDLKIGVDKEYIDKYREDFLKRPSYSYPMALGPSYVTFANSLYPIHLQDSERYITFAYDEMPAQSKIVPTWIGKAGEKFKLDYAGNIDYLQHASRDDNDLVWCYYNNDCKILSGEMINRAGNKINNNLDGVKVQFEKIYRITVADDNDEKYEPFDDFKNTTVGNTTYANRFVTLDTANALLSQLPARDGFDLGWRFKTSQYAMYNSFENLRETLYDSNYNDNMYISPVWMMKAPTDLKIDFDKSSYVYGDDINMSATAKAANSDFKLKYYWAYFGNGDVKHDPLTGEKYSITNALPQSGYFSVTVTATYENSSLSSDAYVEKVLAVGKRPLYITWEEPDNMVYDSFEKVLVHYCGDDDLINDDFLPNNITETDVRNTNAGKYTASISLKGKINELYYIAAGATHAYTIAQRPTLVEWTSGDYTYDGDYHNASASATNIFGNDLPIAVSQAKINAGIHTAVATCSDGNYQLTNNTYEFEIKQKSIEIANWVNSTLIYSGVAQHPVVSSVSGIVSRDTSPQVVAELVYSGYLSNIDAGENYTVKVDLPSTSNYKFDSEQTKSYNIEKRALRIRAVAADKTYDGNRISLDFAVVSGLASVHTKNSLGTPIYGGNGVNAVDAGNYSVTVSLPNNNVTKNYDITYDGASFTIGKAQARIVWSDVSVNNGVVNPPRVMTSGQVYSSDIVIERYIYRDRYGREIDSIPYESGTYSVSVVATSKNYTFTNTSMTFTVSVEVQGEVA